MASLFVEVVQSELPGVIPIRERASPRMVGGDITVRIDEEEYSKVLVEFVNCLIGILVLSKGDRPPRSMNNLKAKLSIARGINEGNW